MRTTWGIATDRGYVRDVNEDSVLAAPPVFLVADGMGGYTAGDVASRVVVETFRGLKDRPRISTGEVHQKFHAAVARLREVLHVDSPGGTTVAGGALINQDGADYWLIFNIGDSRVYSWQERELKQISVDHSVVQELVDAGALEADEAANHPQRHQVTRALATHVDPDPDYWLLPTDSVQRLLICSDGLTTELPDNEIARILQECSNPQDAADSLIAKALSAGGRDNVSVVVVDLVPVPDAGAGGRDVDSGARTDVQLMWDEHLESTTAPRGYGRPR